MAEQTGGPGPDILVGGDGEDGLYGLGGADTLDGGGGDDWLMGGEGADTIIGGTGNLDYASYLSSLEGVLADLITPVINVGIDALGDTYSGIEGLIGSNFGDSLRGDDGGNYIFGMAGSESLYGRDGVDTLVGGDGADYLHGGEGGDYLIGGEGFDQALYSYVTSGITVDLLHPSFNTGEAVGDHYSSIEGLAGSPFNDTLSGNFEANYLWGGDGNDTLFGRVGDDTLIGGAGDDYLEGGEGRDLFVGGDGVDFAMFTSATQGVRVWLSIPQISTGEAEGDSFFSIEGIWGSNFDDSLAGNGADNILVGGAGDDTLSGAEGVDVLAGGAGNDRLVGGLGRDTFVFGVGAGHDVIADMSSELGYGAAPIDVIQLSTALGVSSFEEVIARAQQVGGATVITFDSDTTLELVGIPLLSLGGDNFSFI
jgi:Ca2+-binding RTX toxin-like protein